MQEFLFRNAHVLATLSRPFLHELDSSDSNSYDVLVYFLLHTWPNWNESPKSKKILLCSDNKIITRDIGPSINLSVDTGIDSSLDPSIDVLDSGTGSFDPTINTLNPGVYKGSVELDHTYNDNYTFLLLVNDDGRYQYHCHNQDSAEYMQRTGSNFIHDILRCYSPEDPSMRSFEMHSYFMSCPCYWDYDFDTKQALFEEAHIKHISLEHYLDLDVADFTLENVQAFVMTWRDELNEKQQEKINNIFLVSETKRKYLID